MKETGIIMSGDHPKLILDGTKTMTRRIRGLGKINLHPEMWELVSVFQDGLARFYCSLTEADITIKCPYGGFGDRLWVKETYYLCVDEEQKIRGDCVYKSSEYVHLVCQGEWKPSIFMPRWASRILLEITEVRVQRVQEITEEDAIKEGCQLIARTIQPFELKPSPHFTAPERPFTHRDHFIGLWDSLNAKRGYSWAKNCWVWPISFRRIKP